MKLGIFGDLHLRSTKPINRTDNYFEKQFEKLNQAFETFTECGCLAVIQPGDFFHNYGKDPYDITYTTIAFLMMNKLPIYIVLGQHDIKFHNLDLTDTPIQLLNETNLVTRLSKEPTCIGPNNDVLLYGSNFGEKIPRIRRDESFTKILVTHRMVIKNENLWPGQEDYIKAKELASKNFDLIISGDNHEAFTYKNELINCGSLTRMRTDQAHHKPIYGVYDTKTKELETFEYKIDPPQHILKERNPRVQKKTEDNKFSKSLENEFDGELDYRQNLNTIIDSSKKKIRKRTREIIEESLN